MSETFVDQMIIGTLLGDAFIQKDGRFGFNHSDKQRDYFNHKVKVLNEAGIKLWLGESIIKGGKIAGRQIKPVNILQARSTKSQRWKELRKIFYPQDKKVLEKGFILTPIALAYLYMDDGSANLRSRYVSYVNGKRYDYNGKAFIQQFRLYVDGFDKESQEILAEQLRNLGIDCWFHERKSGHRYIVISRLKARERFKELIFPYISEVPSMLYKIDRELCFQCERTSEKTP